MTVNAAICVIMAFWLALSCANADDTSGDIVVAPIVLIVTFARVWVVLAVSVLSSLAANAANWFGLEYPKAPDVGFRLSALRCFVNALLKWGFNPAHILGSTASQSSKSC